MGVLSRATRGGVGAVIGVALAAFALSAGWISGSAIDGRAATQACGDACVATSPSATPLSGAPQGAGGQRIAIAAPRAPSASEPDDLPMLNADYIAVIEGGCGAMIFGRNEHEQFPPASLTKLMTAAVATDEAPVDKMITSDVDGELLHIETGSSYMGLKPGMQLSLLDLLYGLLLPSGNDAAIAIAKGISGTEDAFVDLMNAKAKDLGLDDTHFTNPHGLYEDGLHSSAIDMAVLARYVMRNADLRQIVAATSWQPRWDGGQVWNGNRFLTDYAGADGVKIGFTEESKQTIVASATRDGRRIIAALMNSDDRYTDAERLMDWAFEQPSSCP
jgi:D-alanyl-D-alanine carboxypeptidase